MATKQENHTVTTDISKLNLPNWFPTNHPLSYASISIMPQITSAPLCQLLHFGNRFADHVQLGHQALKDRKLDDDDRLLLVKITNQAQQKWLDFVQAAIDLDNLFTALLSKTNTEDRVGKLAELLQLLENLKKEQKDEKKEECKDPNCPVHVRSMYDLD